MIEEHKFLELGIVTDERIADGHYYSRCFRELKKFYRNPELLEEKPESVIFDTDIKRKIRIYNPVGGKIMNRKEQAVMLHKKNFNCAQGYRLHILQCYGPRPVEVFKLAEAFGYGMGTTGTCGAVSGMALVTGMKISDGDLDNLPQKRNVTP